MLFLVAVSGNSLLAPKHLFQHDLDVLNLVCNAVLGAQSPSSKHHAHSPRTRMPRGRHVSQKLTDGLQSGGLSLNPVTKE